MTVNTTVSVVGVKETINALKKIDPQLQKDFRAQANEIAQPAINAAKDVYTQLPLSGMQYKWNSRGRQLFPFTVAKAKNGVKLRIDTRRNAVGVILIEQKDPATAIFETAGRANANRLGDQLGFVGAGRTRLIGPAVYKARRGIETQMEKMILDTARVVRQSL
ncbi:hypothetical protein UFOVP1269_14 [uncultured Caudovirales phage]|uniref:Uncharacterized protein n=1 Tax=uncultured Caudovirales phage TaxID=2100421 RepID=A0A6J5RD01_9CAUD|nr:hypothetical protein UFOVP1269_14 [uncultured Caudovirales phage]